MTRSGKHCSQHQTRYRVTEFPPACARAGSGARAFQKGAQLESASSKRKAEQGPQILKRPLSGGGAGGAEFEAALACHPSRPETETIAALPVTTTPDKGSGKAAAAPDGAPAPDSRDTSAAPAGVRRSQPPRLPFSAPPPPAAAAAAAAAAQPRPCQRGPPLQSAPAPPHRILKDKKGYLWDILIGQIIEYLSGHNFGYKRIYWVIIRLLSWILIWICFFWITLRINMDI